MHSLGAEVLTRLLPTLPFSVAGVGVGEELIGLLVPILPFISS